MAVGENYLVKTRAGRTITGTAEAAEADGAVDLVLHGASDGNARRNLPVVADEATADSEGNFPVAWVEPDAVA